MIRNEEEWIGHYQLKDALWIHDGDVKRPHALLTSGKHSNGFFNSRLIIPDEVLLRDAVSDLLEQFTLLGEDVSKIKCVVGPQTGATKLAELISIQISKYTKYECSWASPSKGGSGGNKLMVFADKDLDILHSKSVLLCEDVITTGGSIDLATKAIVNAGGIVVPFVLVLVNRSGVTEVNGRKIVSLINRAMPIWTPEECPLCKIGSEPVRPKDKWSQLTHIK
jgi:orotate phosphoribosyltransferase